VKCGATIGAAITVAMTTSTFLVLRTEPAADQGGGLQAQFETRYSAWEARVAALDARRSDVVDAAVTCKEFEDLVALGLPVLPLVVGELAKKPTNPAKYHGLCIVVRRLTRFNLPFGPDGLEGWWSGGQRRADEHFANLFRKWRDLKADRETLLWTAETVYYEPSHEVYTKARRLTEAGRVYQAIQDLGIAALPPIAATLAGGEYDFLEIALHLTDHQAPVRQGEPASLPVAAELRAKRFLEWWEQNKEKWTIPWPEEASSEAEAPPAQ
jgi:hypothetical protein